MVIFCSYVVIKLMQLAGIVRVRVRVALTGSYACYKILHYGNKICLLIKTHDSESRGQEEAGRTRRTSELFTRSTALKFVNALNKPP